MKIAKAASFLLAGVLLLSACGTKASESSDGSSKGGFDPPKVSSAAQSEEQSDASSQPEESSAPAVPEDPALTALRQTIQERGYLAGMAFLGSFSYDQGEDDIRAYLKSSQYADYDFLLDAPLVDHGGLEVYAVVTASPDCRASVYPAELGENGAYEVNTDNALYESDRYFLLRCNESDIVSNVLVVFQQGDETASLFPILSGMDGSFCTAEACYDFGFYPNVNDIDDNVIIAYGLLYETEEIQYYTDQGMVLSYTGETQNIDGRDCYLFALATEHDDQLVRERYYAVSDNLIYYYDPVGDQWNILGAG